MSSIVFLHIMNHVSRSQRRVNKYAQAIRPAMCVPPRLHMEHTALPRGIGGSVCSEGVQPVMGCRRFAAQHCSIERLKLRL
jgi:hypothetical protein